MLCAKSVIKNGSQVLAWRRADDMLYVIDQ